MNYTYSKTAEYKGKYDIIVVGGGVAGCAAAVQSAREGKKVILFEKLTTLGGLATNGLVNLFEPLCNGRGEQVMFGMCEEMLKLSIKYGFDTVPNDWKNGKPEKPTFQRYETRFNVPVYQLTLTEWLKNEGVEICFDTILTDVAMDGNTCKGIVVENKSGALYYEASIFIDASGDADLLARAKVPTVVGRNFHTYYAYGLKLKDAQKVMDNKNVEKAEFPFFGGRSNLHGQGHPEGIPTYNATDYNDVNRYLINNQIEMLESIKADERKERYLYMLPAMAQFRTSRRLDGDHTFNTEKDAYKHFEDSIAVIADYERRDFIYEVSYRTISKKGYNNIITAGRTASGEDYGWDIIRSIPACIATGQAAAIASCQALDTNIGVDQIDVSLLQKTLENKGAAVHFDDSLIPEKIEYIFTPTGER